jgi:hypothetical protein
MAEVESWGFPHISPLILYVHKQAIYVKGTVQRDLRGSKVVLIDRFPFKLPTLRSGF